MFTLYSSDLIGNPSNCYYPDRVNVTDEESLKTAISHDYVCAEYKNSYRSGENFLSADCLPVDCDNDHSEDPNAWITPEDISVAFPEVCFAVHYSRHHMKPKGSESARPRFHVLFPIETVTDAKSYRDMKKRVNAVFPYFDKNALDAARFFFGTADPEVEICHGSMNLSEFLNSEVFDAGLPERKIEQGARNSTLSRFAGRVLKRFGIGDKAYDLFLEEAGRCDPPLSDGELESIWKSACRFAEKIQEQPDYVSPEEYEVNPLQPDDYSDIGQARAILREYGSELLYTSATDILRYNGIYWEESKQKAVGAVIEFLDLQLEDAEERYSEALDTLAETGLEKDDIIRGGKSFTDELDKTQSRLYHIFLAQKAYRMFVLKRRDMKYTYSALQALRPMIDVPVEELDKNPWLLNTPSATYDVRYGIAGKRAHDPADKLTKVTAFDPSDEGMELWLDALHEIFGADLTLIDYVQKMLGLAALGKVFVEALIILYGDGRNGKSTFGNAVLKAMGSYGGVISADALTVGCKRNVKPELAELKGKRLLIAAELEEGMRLNTGMIKQLCSVDEISAEKKYKDPFSFTPSHTLLLYTNHLPKVGGTDEGTWRRIIVIPFHKKIAPKKDIKNYAQYLAEHAGGAIIKWIIEGAQKVIADDYRTEPPKSVSDAIEAYREANDWMSHFLEERCETDDAFEEKSGALYQEYRSFCASAGEYTRSTTDFYTELEKRKFRRVKRKDGVHVAGLRIKEEYSII